MNDAAQPVIGRAKSLLSQLLGIAQTRLELLSLELEQERLTIARQLRLAALCAVCLWLGGFTLILWVALSFSPETRFVVLGVLCGVFLLAALVGWIVLKRTRRHGSLFSRVIKQLRLDRASLGQTP